MRLGRIACVFAVGVVLAWPAANHNHALPHSAASAQHATVFPVASLDIGAIFGEEDENEPDENEGGGKEEREEAEESEGNYGGAVLIVLLALVGMALAAVAVAVKWVRRFRRRLSRVRALGPRR